MVKAGSQYLDHSIEVWN